ncbi:MAG: hypothetical protein WDZ66_03155 [Steroidobacteraceae bacterium]
MAIAIAVVGAFIEIPYAGLILVLLGLAAGFAMAAEDHVRVLVSALVLTGLSGVLMNIPEIGQYLTSIFSAVGTFAAGAALMIISRNIWKRYKP